MTLDCNRTDASTKYDRTAKASLVGRNTGPSSCITVVSNKSTRCVNTRRKKNHNNIFMLDDERERNTAPMKGYRATVYYSPQASSRKWYLSTGPVSISIPTKIMDAIEIFQPSDEKLPTGCNDLLHFGPIWIPFENVEFTQAFSCDRIRTERSCFRSVPMYLTKHPSKYASHTWKEPVWPGNGVNVCT